MANYSLELKQTFTDLFSNFTEDEKLISEFWHEIEANHSSKKRHYHTLQHLTAILKVLKDVKAEINNWETILCTLFYHDIIYNPLKSDNEEKSAATAEQRMLQLGINEDMVESCKNQILATKTHILSNDSDTNYFTDADLSVLGQSWEIYLEYYTNVRKEYAIFPNFVYNSGRKKVLQHFLSMERIFKTAYFYNKYEQTARHNLKQELINL